MLKLIGAVALLASTTGQAEEKLGDWTLKTIVDPITDAKRPIAVAEGEGGALVIKCDSPGSDSVYAHFISRSYLGSGSSRWRKLTYRIDGNPPVETRWRYDSTDAIQTGREVHPFLRALMGGERLVIRATDYDYGYVDFAAPIKGGDVVIPRVMQACSDALRI